MHIDRTNQVPVPGKLALAARPVSALGFVFLPTCRTPARCSSFGASEAHDVSDFRFVGQVVNVFAIFPQRHALIVMSATLLVADTMRIAKKEGANVLLNTEVNHLAGGLVSQVTNAPLGPMALLVLRLLQALPASRRLFASGLFLSDLSQLLRPLAFERTDAPPGDNHRFPGVRCDGCQVDFAQVYGGLNRARSLLSLWHFQADVQFIPTIPDQGASSAVFRQIDGQDKRCTTAPHRQHHTSTLFGDRLSRPLDRIEAFGAIGILHLHLLMSLTQLFGGLDVGEEGTHYHLNRLAVQGVLPAFGGFLQFVSPRPLCLSETSSLVRLHTHIPDLCRFHLSRFAALELFVRQGMQLVDFYRIHEYNSTMNEGSLQVGKTRYTHYSIAYHLVWLPKHRRRILTGEVQKETKRLIQECCDRQGLTLLALETDEDHIHVFVSAPPRFSPALIANLLKGYSSRYLREQFPQLKKTCGKEHLWTSCYYVGTAGNVSAEVITRYIEECQGK
jgi:putative transposase